MKKIFWRVFVYFGLVLLLFSVLIGLMFTRFNSTNIVGAYKQQLGDLATGVASRTSKAVSNKENDTFSDYLAAVEDFSEYAECGYLGCKQRKKQRIHWQMILQMLTLPR